MMGILAGDHAQQLTRFENKLYGFSFGSLPHAKRLPTISACGKHYSRI
jgi:hypothetical protein